MHNDYYVYLHRRGDNNEVFYVGKGRGRRATCRHSRNRWWKAVVSKHGFIVEYVERELSEDEAFDLEIELIKFYRDCGHALCNISSGGDGASGTKRTDEHKEKVAAAQRGRPKSEEVKLKMAMQGKKVYCSNGMTFVSCRRATEWLRLTYPKASTAGVNNCCNGKAHSAYGLMWSYEDIFQPYVPKVA